VTGWNLPPGCTDRMVDEAFGYKRDPSDLSEAVRALCEKAGMPSHTIEVILEEIKEWEDDERGPDPDDERDSRADYLYERDR
jgi:hypothetical protein